MLVVDVVQTRVSSIQHALRHTLLDVAVMLKTRFTGDRPTFYGTCLHVRILTGSMVVGSKHSLGHCQPSSGGGGRRRRRGDSGGDGGGGGGGGWRRGMCVCPADSHAGVGVDPGQVLRDASREECYSQAGTRACSGHQVLDELRVWIQVRIAEEQGVCIGR